MSFARIYMVGTNLEEGETLTIHVQLNPDGTASKNYPYAGWRGTPASEWCWPVVFLPEGRVDHGGIEGDDEGERFSEMDIYNRPFEMNSIYIMKHNDGSPETEFKIMSIEIDKHDILVAENRFHGRD